MSYLYRDVRLVDGVLRKMVIDGRWLTFNGEEAPYDLGEVGIMGRLGNWKAIYKTSNDHMWLLNLADGSKRDLGPVLGNWAGAFGPNGDIFLQVPTPAPYPKADGEFYTMLRVLDANGTEYRRQETLYNSSGISYVDAHGVPIIVPNPSYVTIAGVDKCLLPMTADGATVSQCDHWVNSGGFLVTPQGDRYAYNVLPPGQGYGIDKYPFVASDGTSTWAALQGFDTPEPDDLSTWVKEGGQPGYNPKPDLIAIRAELDRVIGKLP